MPEVKFKPAFSRTAERFEAWWHRAIVDRPPVTLHVTQDRVRREPCGNHTTIAEGWLDADYQVERQIAVLEQTEFPGDTLPIVYANLGPELVATALGATVEYIDERTGWTAPVVSEMEDWQHIIDAKVTFSNPWWEATEQITRRAIEMNDGRYLVGLTDLHGNYDILAALRDPQALCMDLLDCPELVLRAGRRATEAYVASFERCYRQIAAAGFGSTTWTPFYHDGPAYLPSCDFWCMVSPRIARDSILPDIIAEMRPLERSLFHLDGPGALPHLDQLLDLPELDGVQWVYGAGNGPASRWIDTYRRIQAAGKCMQINAEDGRDALRVLEQLQPEGVWLVIGAPFSRAEEADAFLHDVQTLAAKRVGPL